MDCDRYIALFSDYLDGRTGAQISKEMEGHRESCSHCSGYSEALQGGLELLRGLPPLEVPSDFRPRLDHRIYHIEDWASIAREALGTGATTVSVLAVAVLLAFAAWTPTVRMATPSVDLPALVVQAPPHTIFTRRDLGPTFSRNLSLFRNSEFQDGFWGDAPQLLFEYSVLSQRRRDPAFAGIAIE